MLILCIFKNFNFFRKIWGFDTSVPLLYSNMELIFYPRNPLGKNQHLWGFLQSWPKLNNIESIQSTVINTVREPDGSKP